MPTALSSRWNLIAPIATHEAGFDRLAVPRRNTLSKRYAKGFDLLQKELERMACVL